MDSSTVVAADAISGRSGAIWSSGVSKDVKAPELQWLRGIAAILVVLYHAAVFQQTIHHKSEAVAVFNGVFGWYGVAVFFSISGFLMANLIRRQNGFQFLLHRVVRIYPLYFIAIALFVSAFHLMRVPTGWTFLASSLVPGAMQGYPLGVEWTLVFELAYYVSLFAIAILGWTRFLDRIAAVWLLIVLLFPLLRIEPVGQANFPIWMMPFVTANAPFAAGLLLPTFISRRPHPLILLLFAAILLFFGLWASNWYAHRCLTGLSATCVVAAAAASSHWYPAFQPRRLVEIGLGRLGDFSYALYLCHVPTIRIFYTRIADVGDWTTWLMAVSLAVAVSIPLGLLDLNIYRRLKSIVDGQPSAILRLMGGGFVSIYLVLSLWLAYSLISDPNRDTKADTPDAWMHQAVTSPGNGGIDVSRDLIGHTDEVEWQRLGELRIAGWAADRSHPNERVRVGVVMDGKLVATSLPTVVREDVASALGVASWETVPTGFEIRLKASCIPGLEPRIAVFAPVERHAILTGPEYAPACP